MVFNIAQVNFLFEFFSIVSLSSYWPAIVSLAIGVASRIDPRFRNISGLLVLGSCASFLIMGSAFLWLLSNALGLYGLVRLAEMTRVNILRSFLFFLAYMSIICGFVLVNVGIGLSIFNYLPILGMIHFLKYCVFVWESQSGDLKNMPLPHFLAWSALPFVDICLRPSDFMRQLEAPLVPCSIDLKLIRDFLMRLLMICAAHLLDIVGAYFEHGELFLRRFYPILILGPWGFYLKFAAIYGLFRNAGALAGIDVPENFKSPFMATNISDFWSRWNIGATHAFRDMLFFNRFGFSFYNPYMNTMLVFLFMGAWHAINPYWLLFGLIHGVGFCCYIAFGSRLDWSSNWKLRLLGWACTYLFVCSCWALPPQLMKLGRAFSATLGVS